MHNTITYAIPCKKRIFFSFYFEICVCPFFRVESIFSGRSEKTDKYSTLMGKNIDSIKSNFTFSFERRLVECITNLLLRPFVCSCERFEYGPLEVHLDFRMITFKRMSAEMESLV